MVRLLDFIRPRVTGERIAWSLISTGLFLIGNAETLARTLFQ